MDKIKHFFLLLFVTFLFGELFAAGLSFGKEGAQAEYGNASVSVFLKRFFSKDTLTDFIADILGITIGILIRGFIHAKTGFILCPGFSYILY